MLIFEVGYLFPLLVFAFAFCEFIQTRKIPRQVWPIVILLFAQFGLYAYVQLTGWGTYVGTALTFDLLTFLKAFRVQLLAGIPMTWITKTNFALIKQLFAEAFSTVDLRHILTYGIPGITGIWLCVLVGKKAGKGKPGKGLPLMLSGAILWVGAAFLVSMTVKYQEQIAVTGSPYIPLYIEHFGVVLFVVGLLVSIGPKTRTAALVVLFAGLYGILLPVQQAYTRREEQSQRSVYILGRDEYKDALYDGILEQPLEQDAVFLTDASRCFWGNNYFAALLGRPVIERHINTEGDLIEENPCYITTLIYADPPISVLCKVDGYEEGEDGRTYWISDIVFHSTHMDCGQYFADKTWTVHMEDGTDAALPLLDHLSRTTDTIWQLDLGGGKMTLAELQQNTLV